MVNILSYCLTPPRNENIFFFGIDRVGDPTSSTVFVSVDRRYCGFFEHNYSGCMIVFAIRLSRGKVLELIWILKKEISLFLSSKV